ncbi:actophorin-like isoform X1 [Mytilus californianus]|uniref:actophorin-like isoform X1 n=1 Tax=Mytilus californianus TaxID=6549 RepID=UPI0022480B40|nr:actophorin-like isoform X1 [Mytilus californianus]
MGDTRYINLNNAGPSSGVAVCDECVRVFFEIKRDHKWQYVIYKITDDLKSIVVEERGGKHKTYQDFVNKLKEAEKKGQCRYGLFDVKFSCNDIHSEKLAFFLWSPDTATTRQKMVYSTSAKALKQRLNGLHIVIQCNDETDLALSHVFDKCSAKYV